MTTNILKYISKPLQSISTMYKKTSTWGKVLFFVILLLIVVGIFRSNKMRTEGFEQNDKFMFKTDSDVYDDFYSDIYDQLVFNNLKDDIIGIIANTTNITNTIVIICLFVTFII